MKGWFVIPKAVIVIHHNNRIKKKNHKNKPVDPKKKKKKHLDKNQQTFKIMMKIMLIKLGIEYKYFNSIKNIKKYLYLIQYW
jgi:hypothetical protein